MGIKNEIRLVVLAVLFFCACVAVYGRGTAEIVSKKPPLADTFSHIEGYKLLRNIKLADEAFDMLNLDDYIYNDYAGPSGPVNLYIGYYFSAGKAYASHSPTICYPSQGWKVDTAPASGRLKIGPHTVNFLEITTSFGGQKELVIYWYQARLYTNTQVYKNKIDMGYNKLAFGDDHHGFIRVAVPFNDNGYAKAKIAALDFINSIYPKLEKYLTYSYSTFGIR